MSGEASDGAFRRLSGRHATTTPYLLDVRSDLLDGLDSRMVIPRSSLKHFPKVTLSTPPDPGIDHRRHGFPAGNPEDGRCTPASAKVAGDFSQCGPRRVVQALTRAYIMRLSASQQQCILDATRRYFGAGAKVWLFGSRVDDRQRGGDVDLYVEPALRCKLAIEEGLDMHVDLLVNDRGDDKPIYAIPKQTGVLL